MRETSTRLLVDPQSDVKVSGAGTMPLAHAEHYLATSMRSAIPH